MQCRGMQSSNASATSTWSPTVSRVVLSLAAPQLKSGRARSPGRTGWPSKKLAEARDETRRRGFLSYDGVLLNHALELAREVGHGYE